MATVTIVITDTNEDAGEMEVDVNFDPPVDIKEKPTSAQATAVCVIEMLKSEQ